VGGGFVGKGRGGKWGGGGWLGGVGGWVGLGGGGGVGWVCGGGFGGRTTSREGDNRPPPGGDECSAKKKKKKSNTYAFWAGADAEWGGAKNITGKGFGGGKGNEKNMFSIHHHLLKTKSILDLSSDSPDEHFLTRGPQKLVEKRGFGQYLLWLCGTELCSLSRGWLLDSGPCTKWLPDRKT